MQQIRKIGLIFVFVFFSIVLVMPMLLLGYGFYSVVNTYINACGQKDAINSGVIVEAEIVDTYPMRGNSKTLRYEYYDEVNAVYYDGSAGFSAEYDKASEYFGKKVNIYIDGKGHSIAVGDTPDTVMPLVGAVLFPILMIAYVSLIIILWKKESRKNKQARSDGSLTKALAEQTADNVLNVTATSQNDGNIPDLQKDFNFKLTIADEYQGNNNEIIDPTERDIETAIEILKNSYGNFVILDSAYGISDVLYIQAINYESESDSVYAELRVKSECGKEISYSKRLLIQDFSRIMNDFLEGYVPDYRNWTIVNI